MPAPAPQSRRVPRGLKKPELKRRAEALFSIAREHGVEVGGLELAPDGTLRLLPPSAAGAQDAFTAWQEKHGAKDGD